jgi:hypothetical protein
MPTQPFFHLASYIYDPCTLCWPLMDLLIISYYATAQFTSYYAGLFNGFFFNFIISFVYVMFSSLSSAIPSYRSGFINYMYVRQNVGICPTKLVIDSRVVRS